MLISISRSCRRSAICISTSGHVTDELQQLISYDYSLKSPFSLLESWKPLHTSLLLLVNLIKQTLFSVASSVVENVTPLLDIVISYLTFKSKNELAEF